MLPLDQIFELPDTFDLESVPESILEPSLHKICTVAQGDGAIVPTTFRLDKNKFIDYANSKATKVAKNLPSSLQAEFVDILFEVPLGFTLDVSEQDLQKAKELAQLKAGLQLVSSYLLPEIEAELMAKQRYG